MLIIKTLEIPRSYTYSVNNMEHEKKLSAGTGSSITVNTCQVCENSDLKSALFLGYLPPVNQMRFIGDQPHEQPSYPAEMLYCPECELVQIGCIVDPQILFPADYPYTSGTTRILHQNFTDLSEESRSLLELTQDDLVIDVGSNDGTLLSKFQGKTKVLGIEPTDAGKLAIDKGIETITAYFTPQVATDVQQGHGAASLVTAANCFAHIEDVHSIVEGVMNMLQPDGVFINESHYLVPLLDTLQYDTIYHEHLRYYSLTSLSNLFSMHGLEIIHAKHIPSHGGSIRVYAARKGTHEKQDSVKAIMQAEKDRGPMSDQLDAFKTQVVQSKLKLNSLLSDIKERGERVIGISAPSRASTLANYIGLDDGIIDYIVEIEGSKNWPLLTGNINPGHQ